MQARRPHTGVSLSRVGVTGVEKILRIRAHDDEQLYHATLECYVDLNPLQAGVHMSRFEEIVNEAVDAVVIGEALKAEGLAAHIAERVRERQHGLRAEVTIRARYPEYKQTPVSGLTTQELYTLIGTAVASEQGVRRLVGVEAQGMTACPCAQELVAARRASGSSSRASPTTRSSGSSKPFPSRPTTSAASGASTSAAPRAATPSCGRRPCCASSRSR